MGMQYWPCKAVCESTGNHRIKTADAFEKASIPLQLANPFKIKAIAWSSIKNYKVDARHIDPLCDLRIKKWCTILSPPRSTFLIL